MYNFLDFNVKLNKILEHTRQDIGLLRTGKASSNMLDSVRVSVYGTQMSISELANISTPDSNMIIIDPWDKNILGEIEKAINIASLNFNPVVDKQIIRIVIPALTEERRKELVKQLHQKSESAKMMMRTARIETKNEIENQKGEAGVSEDDIHRNLEELDKIMDEFEARLVEIISSKENDLLSI